MKWVLLVGVVVVLSSCSKKDESLGSALPPPTGEGATPVAVPAVSDLMKPQGNGATPSNGDFSATGTLYPKDQAELGPKVTGVIRSVEVDEGDKVKKGQVVFRLDSAQASLVLQQAQTQVVSAKTNLRATELEFERAKELNARGSLPAATLEQIQARHEAAQNAVAQAEVAVAMAKRSLSDTVVTSPINGVVTARNKEPGETATMMPVTVVVVIQDVSVLELRVRLPEGSLKNLTEDSMLHVALPAVGAERDVKVERINPAVDVATRTVEVVAAIDNSDGSLKPGMLANVTLANQPDSPRGNASAAAGSEATGSKSPVGAEKSGAKP